jgi:UDP-N-acetylmuramate dehydrogenase
MAGFSGGRKVISPGVSAGRLIDGCGLKGCRNGGALVSEKHANFIVNAGNATCGDVLTLMRRCRSEVESKYGIRLEPEIWIWR